MRVGRVKFTVCAGSVDVTDVTMLAGGQQFLLTLETNVRNIFGHGCLLMFSSWAAPDSREKCSRRNLMAPKKKAKKKGKKKK